MLSIDLKENLPIESVAKEDDHKAVDLARQVHRHLEQNCDLADISLDLHLGYDGVQGVGVLDSQLEEERVGGDAEEAEEKGEEEDEAEDVGETKAEEEADAGDAGDAETELDPVHLEEILQQLQSKSSVLQQLHLLHM